MHTRNTKLEFTGLRPCFLSRYIRTIYFSGPRKHPRKEIQALRRTRSKFKDALGRLIFMTPCRVYLSCAAQHHVLKLCSGTTVLCYIVAISTVEFCSVILNLAAPHVSDCKRERKVNGHLIDVKRSKPNTNLLIDNLWVDTFSCRTSMKLHQMTITEPWPEQPCIPLLRVVTSNL